MRFRLFHLLDRGTPYWYLVILRIGWFFIDASGSWDWGITRADCEGIVALNLGWISINWGPEML